MVLACFWTKFQAKRSILDPIRAIFDDLGPDRHLGPDLDQAWDWPEALAEGPGQRPRPAAHTFFFPTKKRKAGLFLFSEGGFARNADLGSDPLRIKQMPGVVYFQRGVADPPPKIKKKRLFFFS